MGKMTIGYNVSGGGESISGAVTRENDGVHSISPLPVIPAGKTGTLSTRTDDDTGTLTLVADHGIQTADVIDLYWPGGSRRGITVGTVSGTSVPIGADNAGEGDNLPAQATAIVCSPRVEVELGIDHTELEAFAVQMARASAADSAISCVRFIDDGAASLDLLLHGNTPKIFDMLDGQPNPFTAAGLSTPPLIRAYASNGSPSLAASLKLIYVADHTP